LVFNDPLVNVIELVAVKLSCKVQPPPTPLNIKDVRLTPFVVMVLPVVVAAKVICKEPPMLRFVDGKVKFPKTDNVEPASDIEPSNALAPVPKLMLLQTAEEEALTENPPVPTLELLSKITSSAEVGTPAPPLPPEPLAQFVVATLVQFPVPPTQ